MHPPTREMGIAGLHAQAGRFGLVFDNVSERTPNGEADSLSI
jgi:hypothetical protein